MKKFLFTFVVSFLFLLFFSTTLQSQISYGSDGSVLRYCYEDTQSAERCVVIDYSRMSEYEFSPPLNQMRGLYNEYVDFPELGDGVRIKYKAVQCVQGYEDLIKIHYRRY